MYWAPLAAAPLSFMMFLISTLFMVRRPGLAAFLIIGPWVAAGLWVVVRGYRRLHAVLTGNIWYCPTCHYPLPEAEEGHCPECGEPYRASTLRRRWASKVGR